MNTVVGVDPGGTTGIALWSKGGGLTLREMPTAIEAVDWISDMTHVLAPTVFVVERYIITPATAKMSQQHDALEIIGAIKYLTRVNGHEVVMQTPAEAKAFSTDDKLKTLGWYQRGQPHARDASRHVLLYLAKQDIIDLASLTGVVH